MTNIWDSTALKSSLQQLHSTGQKQQQQNNAHSQSHQCSGQAMMTLLATKQVRASTIIITIPIIIITFAITCFPSFLTPELPHMLNFPWDKRCHWWWWVSIGRARIATIRMQPITNRSKTRWERWGRMQKFMWETKKNWTMMEILWFNPDRQYLSAGVEVSEVSKMISSVVLLSASSQLNSWVCSPGSCQGTPSNQSSSPPPLRPSEAPQVMMMMMDTVLSPWRIWETSSNEGHLVWKRRLHLTRTSMNLAFLPVGNRWDSNAVLQEGWSHWRWSCTSLCPTPSRLYWTSPLSHQTQNHCLPPHRRFDRQCGCPVSISCDDRSSR